MPPTLSPPEAKNIDSYLAHWERLEEIEASRRPRWLHSIRQAGIAHFAEVGLPTTRDEEWRFTNLAPLTRLPFNPLLSRERHGLTLAGIAPFCLPDLRCRRLVFVDGHFAASLSSLETNGDGVKVGSLAQAIDTDAGVLEQHLATYAHPGDNPFVALNTAFFQDGAFMGIGPESIVTEPIHLLHIATAPRAATAAHIRHLIVAQRNCRVAVIESFVNWAEPAYVTNAVTEIMVGEGAVVEHYRIQNEGRNAFHIATVQARQDRNSRLISHAISVGSSLARHNIQSVLNGEGADCLLNGLYCAAHSQLVDHHTVIDHAKPGGTSHEFYHGILAGEARGVFNGKILVRRDAQKTDAKQTNRNLLLSEHAMVNTKPQLEIFADDVKCTHGATVGQLDDEALFYLQSRGIDRDAASRMLVRAFAEQIIDRLNIPAVRRYVQHLIFDEWQAAPPIHPAP